ncbi:MAG TPA: nuclear transport factor 2 family protein [Aestuariivirgaceae bacterium]|nr:nuclear transport factor 2 family protein [Aestuariivirgaceae bacterium]
MSLAEADATVSDVEAIRAIIDAIAAAAYRKDAAAMARHYAPGAVIADLAPPLLSRGYDVAKAQGWLDNWDGPVEIEMRDLTVEADGNLGLCHALQYVRARTPQGEEAAWWSRVTLTFARTGDAWQITHEHNSVPFHMDGSYRAAVDLDP